MGNEKHPPKEKLVLFAYGEMSFAGRALTRLHILFCSECRKEWKETSAVLKSLRQERMEAPAHLVDRVLDLARSTLPPAMKGAATAEERLPRPGFPRLARLLVPAAAALTVAALYLVSSVIKQDTGLTHVPRPAGNGVTAVEAGFLAYVLSNRDATGLEIENQIYDISERISLAFLTDEASGFDLAVSDVEDGIQQVNDKLQDMTQL